MFAFLDRIMDATRDATDVPASGPERARAIDEEWRAIKRAQWEAARERGDAWAMDRDGPEGM